jgi:hypothetical protein
MAGHGTKLDRKREQAIAALLSEPTVEAAAKKARVGYRTLKEWLRDPGFLADYRAARRDVVEAAVVRLQQMTLGAALTLHRNLTCGKAGDEVRAAIAVLDQAFRGTELLDLAGQLAELKQAVEKQNQSQGANP